MRNKNTMIFMAILIGFAILFLTGCNQQVFDFNYTFDRAVCNIGGEYQEIEIDKWNDYEGEQLQIIGEDGKVYLVSSLTCTLIKD